VAEPARQVVAAVETVPLRSQRFGDYDIAADRVLCFPDGLIGFAEAHRFAVLDSNRRESPFSCLVCLDFPELGFVVCDPVSLWPAYAADLPPSESGRDGDRAALAIVTIPQDPRAMTANLLAPLVFDCGARTGRQVVLDGERYSTRHPLLAG
jgi:flagellar assembly factor FliW